LRVEHLDLPTAALGVAGVHLQQIPGEQCGLLAALAGLDLHQGVGEVVGITRGQQLGQPLGHRLESLLQLGSLGSENRILRRKLAGRRKITGEPVMLVQCPYDRHQLGIPPADPAGPRQVGVHLRVGKRRLELRELRTQVLGSLEHPLSVSLLLSCAPGERNRRREQE
jgi:hypothetical protein